jgi:hypothetical protein
MKTKEMQQVMRSRKKKVLNEVIEKELFDVSQRQTLNKPKNIPNPVKHPDPKLHQQVSFVKSGVRIVSCLLGFAGMYEIGFLGLFLAELIGVYEELV